MSEPSNSAALHRFNGGKMQHVFKSDEKTHLYIDEFESPEAKDALETGVIYTKIHGSNGALVLDQDGTIQVYNRHNFKQKASQDEVPPGHIALPPNGNPASISTHNYFYEWANPNVQGKKMKKRNQSLYDVVRRHKVYLENELLRLGGFMTVEWVGYKFNRTPGVEADVALCLHHEQLPICGQDGVPRTYNELKTWMQFQGTEGVVVEKGGVFWKVRSDRMFENSCISEAPVVVYT